MSHTLHRKYTEIPLLINNNLKYVKGVSKYTTCSDVIKMILKKTDVGASVKNASDGYGIYERSRGIERLLPGKGRILKVMRSWGTDVEYELVFRPVSTTYSVPKISEAKRRKLTNRHRAIHAETLAGLVESQKDKLNKAENGCDFVKEIYDSDASMDDFLSQVDRNNMKGILQFCDAVSNEEINKMSSANVSRNVTGQSESFGSVSSQNVNSNYNVNDVKYAVRKTLKTKQCVSSSSDSNNSGTEIHATPNLKAAKEKSRSLKARHEKFANDIASKVARMNQKEGKEALLQKYFADYITYRSPGYSFLDTRYRERGDGAESASEVPSCRQADGAEINAGVKTVTPKLRTSRTSLDFNKDDRDDVSSDSGQEDDAGSLDTAFILNQALVAPQRVVDTSDIASGYKVPNVSPCIDEYENDVEDEDHHDIFNANIITGSGCHINKLVDYSFSEDDSILTDDPSIISSVSENVHDVSSVSDIVKGLFGEQKAASEDDEMESFMNTKLCDDFSDEGLSSLGSDDDREIMV